MLAEENLREGKLEASLSHLEVAIRKDPSNAKYRVFLFQLLSLLGEWDRAMTQLSVAADLDASTLAMVQTYREALRCEALRVDIFSGKRDPLLFGEPEEWLALLMEAHRLSTEGQFGVSQEVRGKAFDAAPVTSGMIDGKHFEWISDADPRLGPVLEAIINGHYYWLPFHRLKEIRIEQPVDLRDHVWMPAYFTFVNGGETVGLIPTRYPGTEVCQDSQVRMGRKTIWLKKEVDFFLGKGQRLLTTDQAEYPVMDIRKIEMNTSEDHT